MKYVNIAEQLVIIIKQLSMAKNKEFELKYKIEGLKRMCKRKVKRGLKNRHRSLMKQKWISSDDDIFY